MKTMYEKQMKNAEKYRKYFQGLRKSDPERAKKESTKELISMGLLDEDGKPKERIVTWD